MKRILSLAVAGMLLASAPVRADGPNAAIGTIVGAAGGALIGSQIGQGQGRAAATAAGVALGAVIGNSIGRDADRAYGTVHDRRWRPAPPPAFYYPGPPPPTATYVYDPAPTYRQRCRQVAEEVFVNGWPRTVYRTACRQRDGSWRIVR